MYVCHNQFFSSLQMIAVDIFIVQKDEMTAEKAGQYIIIISNKKELIYHKRHMIKSLKYQDNT